MVQYDQTAYGKVTVLKDTVGIANINPFRYKGYYYDQESGMYYCHTRYFVPECGRWLNADERCFNPLSINRVNLFSFSSNYPTMLQEVNLKISEGYDTIKMVNVPIIKDEQSVNGEFNFALADVVMRTHTTVGLAPDSFTRRFWGDLSYTITNTTYKSSNHPWFYGFTDSGLENGVKVDSIGGGIKLPGGFGIEGGLNLNGNVFINAQLSNISIGVQYGVDGLSISLGADLGNGVSGAFTLSIGQGTILAIKVVVAVIALCVYAPQAVVEFGKIIVEFGSAILAFLQ